MGASRTYDLSCKPVLACAVEFGENGIAFTRDGQEFEVSFPAGHDRQGLETLLRCFDGSKTAADILDETQLPSNDLFAIIEALDAQALLDDLTAVEGRAGIDVLLELEDLANDLLYKTLYKNKFWQAITSTITTAPENVLYGLAIENYHFLFRESYFDAGALSYQASTRARSLMNEFYAEEYGHDELLLKGLNAIGISREDLADTLPLPETMGLCNALAFWANFDTLFFFTTIGILEGKDIKEDSYLGACDRANLQSEFIAPLRAHSRLNLDGNHGSLTRSIFKEIDSIDVATVQRFRRQTYLFVEIYDAFYTAVWKHYSTAGTLLRRLSEI